VPVSEWGYVGNGLDSAFDCELMKAGLAQLVTEGLNDPKLLAAGVNRMTKKPTTTELGDARAAFPVFFKAAVCIEADDPRLNTPLSNRPN
jgi:hypothetical protein